MWTRVISQIAMWPSIIINTMYQPRVTKCIILLWPWTSNSKDIMGDCIMVIINMHDMYSYTPILYHSWHFSRIYEYHFQVAMVLPFWVLKYTYVWWAIYGLFMVHNDISIAIIIIFVCYSSSKEASIDSHTCP